MTTFTEEIASSTTKLQKTTGQLLSTVEIISSDKPTEQLMSRNEITTSTDKVTTKPPLTTEHQTSMDEEPATYVTGTTTMSTTKLPIRTEQLTSTKPETSTRKITISTTKCYH